MGCPRGVVKGAEGLRLGLVKLGETTPLQADRPDWVEVDTGGHVACIVS
jgi:hypothetical protein